MVVGLFAALAAHVLVNWIGVPLGLIQAWTHLERLSSEHASSISDYGRLVGQNVVFGMFSGIAIGALRYRRLQTNKLMKWLLEAVLTPTGYSATKVGLSCLVLHVSISVVVAIVLSVFGVLLPLPHFAGETYFALLATGNQFVAGGGGGSPDSDILVNLISAILIIAFFASVFCTEVFGIIGLKAAKKVKWSTTGSIVAEGASYGAAVEFGVTLLIVTLGKLRKPGRSSRPLTPDEQKDDVLRRLYAANLDEGIWDLLGEGVWNGTVHSLVYALVIICGSATFGLVGH
jgi:hypothetical protein